MKMRIATVLLFCVIGQAAFAESKLKSDVWEVKKGLWEVTSLIEMHGLPVELPAVTNQQCFDKDNAVPKSPQQDENCEVSQKLGSNHTVSWTLVCLNDRGELKGNGEIRYKDETFKGFLKMVLKNQEGQLIMDSTLEGRYLGPCK